MTTILVTYTGAHWTNLDGYNGPEPKSFRFVTSSIERAKEEGAKRLGVSVDEIDWDRHPKFDALMGRNNSEPDRKFKGHLLLEEIEEIA